MNPDILFRVPSADAPRLFADNAALAWVVESSIIATATGSISIVGGMGLPEGMLIMPGDDESHRFVQLMLLARRHDYSTWRGLDVRHLARAIGSNREFRALDVFAALEAGQRALTQELLDFLTLRDVDGAQLDVHLVMREDYAELNTFSRDEMNLLYAFRGQMLAEAAPHQHQVAVGAYVLERTPLRFVDEQVGYDTLRLVIHPRGILCSLVSGNWFVPFAWSPGGVNTSTVWMHPRGVFAMDALLACIWRDACVVREAWSTRTNKRGHSSRGSVQRPKHVNPVVLPRVIYQSRWGASDEERDAVTYQSRNAHAVRAHYRVLAEGRKSSDAASSNAESFGFPPPPDGYTFVQPHIRGEGAVQQVRRVVCRGLQVANIVMN